MEMDQLQALFHVFLFEEIERFEQLAGCQAELAGVSPALFPFATSGGSELDAYPNIGAYTELFGDLRDKLQLIQFFYNEEDTFAHLLCQQGKLNVAFVLVSVADNQGIGIRVHGNHGMQFRFGAGFKTEIEFLSVTDNLLDHRAHLIHFNRVDDKVLGFIAVLFRCLFKAFGYLFDAVVQNIGEAKQHRSCHVTQLQLVYQFFQIHLYTVFAGFDNYVPVLIDTKVRSAPAGDVVKLF